jgi:hypothetical protein
MKQIFNVSLGLYSFRRIVQPHNIEMLGTATLKKITNHKIECFEEGFYYLNNEKRDFYKKMFFVTQKSCFKILKSNGEILHTIKKHKPEHTHICNNDHYTIKITMNNSSFETFYKIEGPQKNMTISTIYRKIEVL